MLSFTDFVHSFPTCRVVENSVSAKFIYEHIIWRDDTRIKFVELSDSNIPALSACADEIEKYCTNNTTNDLDLSNRTVKQTVGRMVAAAIEPFGYATFSKRRMPKNLSLSYFSNATIFKYAGGETQKIVKTIVNC